ncbi:glycosyltransferase family 2 protein [Curvivirga aplysinae]|uniref:glycosyltransferase family 2 protein n=1 Tax=Curvivirga aplysinae TaxID=2529852 RepID=UPI0012BC34F8|nr:glycosyltransferase family 2 protein [Curvivirga aplysinae]MTI09484.1 glycosyltransferase [Curvivirga aplysinae]
MTSAVSSVTQAAKIAVVLPCYNEEGAIGKVVTDFKAALPYAEIYVFDNNSKDNTVTEAKEAGATVLFERQQGKGNVVRRIFSEIDADCYIMADGDDTYDAASAQKLVDAIVKDRCDMVVGTRQPVEGEMTYRQGHAFGNILLTTLARFFFGRGFTDMLSGYRGFSRRFAKSFPVMSGGFEIETEMTIHCLSLGLPSTEIATPYYERAEGTESKLNTYQDGFRILMTMVRLFKDYRPMAFFTIGALILALLSIGISTPVIFNYLETGLVERLPTAVLSMGIMVSAILALACGFILDSVAQQRLETKRLSYLSIPFLKD